MREMSLVQHLDELRRTLIRVVGILAFAFIFAYSYGEYIAEFLLQPLRVALGVQGGKVIAVEILDKVLAQLQVAFWASVIVSSPLWFYQVWTFIKPGLYKKEIKVIRPFLFLSFIFFCLGVGFGYYIVFPLTFKVLMKFGVADVESTIAIKTYLVLACKVLVFLGFVFQLPNVLMILGFMGLVTKQSLSKMRRYIYVAFAIVSAMLTPPDPFTMMALWLPLVLLFEIGVVAVAFVVHPYLERQHRS